MTYIYGIETNEGIAYVGTDEVAATDAYQCSIGAHAVEWVTLDRKLTRAPLAVWERISYETRGRDW